VHHVLGDDLYGRTCQREKRLLDVADIGVGAVGGSRRGPRSMRPLSSASRMVRSLMRARTSASFVSIRLATCLQWDVAVVAEIDDAADLGQGEACCLCGSNKVQPGERGFAVDAVAVRAAHGLG
jgi:hypothetical protein